MLYFAKFLKNYKDIKSSFWWSCGGSNPSPKIRPTIIDIHAFLGLESFLFAKHPKIHKQGNQRNLNLIFGK